MSEHWKKQDRPCPPCSACGTALYEKFWGGGGWVKTEATTNKAHGPDDCVKVLRAAVAGPAVVRSLLAALPRCNGCEDPRVATRTTKHGLTVCDCEVHDASGPHADLPYASLVRRMQDSL